MIPRQTHDICVARTVYNQYLLRSSDFSDLTIRCGNTSFKVHRAVVCVCPFFAGACAGGFKEAKSGIIDMSHDDSDVIQALLQYLYTEDYLESLHTRTSLLFISRLYASAEMHDVAGLKKLIVHDMSSKLDHGLKDDDSKLDFLKSVLHIYDNTMEADRVLRQLVVSCTLRNAKDLFEEPAVARTSRQVLRECPDFAVDLALYTAGVSGIEAPEEAQKEKSPLVTSTSTSVALTRAGYDSSDEDGFV